VYVQDNSLAYAMADPPYTKILKKISNLLLFYVHLQMQLLTRIRPKSRYELQQAEESIEG
jgi:hypothetical protein